MDSSLHPWPADRLNPGLQALFLQACFLQFCCRKLRRAGASSEQVEAFKQDTLSRDRAYRQWRAEPQAGTHGLPENFEALLERLCKAPDDWPLRDRRLAVFIRDVIAERRQLESGGCRPEQIEHSRPSGTRSSVRDGVVMSTASPNGCAR